MAAVIVSVVHVCRGTYRGSLRLEGKDVQKITAFLFHAGDDHDPHKLAQNVGKSSLGSKPYGQGFLFADDDPQASPIELLEEIVRNDPRNRDKIRPYLGGQA